MDENINPKIWTKNLIQKFLDANQTVPSYLWKSFSSQRVLSSKGDLSKAVINSKAKDKITYYEAYEKDIAIVNFHLDKSVVFRFTKQERMSQIDFIAQLGGTFGVFLGISFVSLIELAYWILLGLFKFTPKKK